MSGLGVEPVHVVDRTAARQEFQARAQRERARVQALMRVVSDVAAGRWNVRTSPGAVVARILGEAETDQVRRVAALVAAAVATAIPEQLEEAMEELRWEDEGLASQSGALAPGVFDRLWLAAIDNKVADAVIVVGVGAREAVGAPIPEAENGRDQALVEAGKALGAWGFGLAIVALGIGGAVLVWFVGGKKP